MGEELARTAKVAHVRMLPAQRREEGLALGEVTAVEATQTTDKLMITKTLHQELWGNEMG